MGISNACFIVWCIALVTLNLFRPFISILCLCSCGARNPLYSKRWKGCATTFQCFHANEIFTGKSDWQGSAVFMYKVATKTEAYYMFLGQLRLTHAREKKKVAAFMNEAPMKYAFKVMKKRLQTWIHYALHRNSLDVRYLLLIESCSKMCTRHTMFHLYLNIVQENRQKPRREMMVIRLYVIFEYDKDLNYQCKLFNVQYNIS